MTMRKFPLDKETALGGPAPYNLVSVDASFDWSSGSKGPQIGINYTTLRLSDMEKVRVFVRDSAPAVSAEIVAQHATAMEFIRADFDGFTASVSADKTGSLRIYAEAEAIRIIQPQAEPKKGG